MRTDDLIAALAADTQRPGRSPALSQAVAIVAGGLLSFGLLLVTLGTREDLVPALFTWRFDLKLALVAAALMLAIVDCLRLASPVATGWASRRSFLIFAFLAAAVAAELYATGPETWSTRLVGTNALVCLSVMPALSLPPLALALIAMRSAAPSSPAAAGAAVGRLAAAVAASLYALHCFDDSPLFVAVWYPLATLPVILLGSFAGQRLLRW